VKKVIKHHKNVCLRISWSGAARFRPPGPGRPGCTKRPAGQARHVGAAHPRHCSTRARNKQGLAALRDAAVGCLSPAGNDMRGHRAG
jgi:hypothetical protein